jgi:SNF2 family DNA or RNA helicase
MKKAIYLPTNENTIVINEFENYFELLLTGEYKTVSKEDVIFLDTQIKISSLDEVKENVFLNCIQNPLSDILYSLNSNRLIPESHQFKPLIKYLNSDNNRILIADEVGLGKTIEAGMIYKEIRSREDIKVSIIVVPPSLTLKWKEELSIRFDEYFNIYNAKQFTNFIDDFDNFSNSKAFDEKIIITYHTLRDENVVNRLRESFLQVDFLIMDEAHTFRNDATSTFEGAETLASLADHILFLTATPVQNDLRDIFNVLSLLDNDYFMDFDYFKRMVEPNKIIHKIIAMLRNSSGLNEIKAVVTSARVNCSNDFLIEIYTEIIGLDSITTENRVKLIDKLTISDHLSFIINRTKKKDVGRLLPRNAKSVVVDITSTEKEFYLAVIEFVKFIHPNCPQGFISIMPERMASSSMLASLESFKKMKAEGKLFLTDIDDLDDAEVEINIIQEAGKYLDMIIEKGERIGKFDSKFIKFREIVDSIQNEGIQQIIVFSFFKYTLNYLQTKLTTLGYKVGIIHGDISIQDRFERIKAFKRGEFDILLSSEVGSEGLDMQFCNVIINYDLPWNPMRVEQRIGRIDRIGQKFDKLHVFNLCIIGSIEDRILLRLYKKLNIFEESLGELEPVLGNLERDINVAELLHLTQEEIDQKIQLQELSIKRQEVEILNQTQELEKLLNDDFETKERQDEILNSKKLTYLKHQAEQLIIKAFVENEIGWYHDRNGTLRLNSDNTKKLFQVLRSKMSDKRTNPKFYKEERMLLQLIQNQKLIRMSFDSVVNEDFNTLFININHPIIRMLTQARKHQVNYSFVSVPNLSEGFAITYRIDIIHDKTKSLIKTMVLDDSLNQKNELDFFDFIFEVTESKKSDEVDFELIKSKANIAIIEKLEELKEAERQNLSRQIEIKAHSINNHFGKKISRTSKMEDAVAHGDIKRMRIAERENLIEQRDLKLKELQSKNKLTASFEIISILKIN